MYAAEQQRCCSMVIHTAAVIALLGDTQRTLGLDIHYNDAVRPHCHSTKKSRDCMWMRLHSKLFNTTPGPPPWKR